MNVAKNLKPRSRVLVALILAWFGAGPAAAIGPGGNNPFSVVVTNPEDSPVPTADLHAPGREPVRIGPINHGFLPSDGYPLAGYEVIDSVEFGKTLVLTYLNVVDSSRISDQPLTEAACAAYLKTAAPGGGNLLTPFLGIPLSRSPNGRFIGSMPLSVPLHAGEGLNVLCVGEPRVSQSFRVTLGGYLLPGSR